MISSKFAALFMAGAVAFRIGVDIAAPGPAQPVTWTAETYGVR